LQYPFHWSSQGVSQGRGELRTGRMEPVRPPAQNVEITVPVPRDPAKLTVKQSPEGLLLGEDLRIGQDTVTAAGAAGVKLLANVTGVLAGDSSPSSMHTTCTV